ncbi:hypothetical protein HMPREF9554_01351 [Treponema phagedenis F0421]|nr:hypothetical protein HMPREF9554_01351 [Treponema phagedenis F0421]
MTKKLLIKINHKNFMKKSPGLVFDIRVGSEFDTAQRWAIYHRKY